MSMEDAHIALPEFTARKFGLFAVFDGHGGNLRGSLGDEVAKFAENHLPVELEKNASFREGNY